MIVPASKMLTAWAPAISMPAEPEITPKLVIPPVKVRPAISIAVLLPARISLALSIRIPWLVATIAAAVHDRAEDNAAAQDGNAGRGRDLAVVEDVAGEGRHPGSRRPATRADCNAATAGADRAAIGDAAGESRGAAQEYASVQRGDRTAVGGAARKDRTAVNQNTVAGRHAFPDFFAVAEAGQGQVPRLHPALVAGRDHAAVVDAAGKCRDRLHKDTPASSRDCAAVGNAAGASAAERGSTGDRNAEAAGRDLAAVGDAAGEGFTVANVDAVVACRDRAGVAYVRRRR